MVTHSDSDNNGRMMNPQYQERTALTLARQVPETPLPFSGFGDKRVERPSRQ